MQPCLTLTLIFYFLRPSSKTSHYLRGGTGNEWDYVIEDGVFERALAYDRIRLQELKWQDFNHRLSKTGLRGGAPIPKKKEPKTKKPKAKGLKSKFVFP